MENNWLDDGEDEDANGVVRVGEYDSNGNSTGACPLCGVSPVYEYGMGGGTCGHYLALNDDWGGQSDWSEMSSLPCLDAKWQATCAVLFPIMEGESVFAPHPLLTASFGGDLVILNAWATKGLCAVPTWDEANRDILLTEANGVEAVGYATGTVFYATDGGAQLKCATARLTESFKALADQLEAFSKNGWTPLHIAALNEDAAELMRGVLVREASPNARDTDGHTALMMSAAIGDVGAVRVLLAAGADANAANNEGRTAWDFAREEECTEILKALSDSGAE